MDPIYRFDVDQIRSRINETYGTVMEQLLKNQGDYLWETIPSPEHLGNLRLSAMETFLSDFDAGKKTGRYIAGELPSLPFESGQFDIALSSHLLFLYSAHLSFDFHLHSLQEMLRVAREVRIFPLLNLDRSPSPHLPVVTKHFAEQGFVSEIKRVPYEFQRGGNEMLVIQRSLVGK